MSAIEMACKELYEYLSMFDEVVGAAVEGKGSKEKIMIYLALKTTRVLNAIPLFYKDFPVEHEVTGQFIG